MKKSFFSTLVIIVTAIFFQSCKNEDSSEIEIERNMSKSELVYPISKETDTSNHIIPITTARNMVGKYLLSKRYIRHRLRAADSWRDDTRCVWFDKKFVEDLYSSFKSEGADGIRVYFGVYDSEYPSRELYKTVIISTTSAKVGSDGVAYHEDILTADRGGDSKRNFWNYQIKEVFNNGGLCPPPNPCYNQGALLLPSNQ